MPGVVSRSQPVRSEMSAISNSISSQATLAQAQAKLAADQAAKADEATLKADQEAVDEAQKTSQQSTTPSQGGGAAPAGGVDITACHLFYRTKGIVSSAALGGRWNPTPAAAQMAAPAHSQRRHPALHVARGNPAPACGRPPN